jgi:hypothetical protein
MVDFRSMLSEMNACNRRDDGYTLRTRTREKDRRQVKCGFAAQAPASVG